eukprot:sb/3477690/
MREKAKQLLDKASQLPARRDKYVDKPFLNTNAQNISDLCFFRTPKKGKYSGQLCWATQKMTKDENEVQYPHHSNIPPLTPRTAIGGCVGTGSCATRKEETAAAVAS